MIMVPFKHVPFYLMGIGLVCIIAVIVRNDLPNKPTGIIFGAALIVIGAVWLVIKHIIKKNKGE